jgi:hypothetical protein
MNFGRLSICTAAALFCACFLCACAATSGSRAQGVPVYLTNSRPVHLLPVSAMDSSLDAPQTIEGAYGEKIFFLEGWTVANDSGLSISLFNTMGASLGTLRYAADSISFESRFIDVKKMKPEYIVADFELCYYKPEAVRGMLAPAGLGFSEMRRDSSLLRTVTSGSDTIVTIERTRKNLHLKNHLRGYEYNIRYGEKD